MMNKILLPCQHGADQKLDDLLSGWFQELQVLLIVFHRSQPIPLDSLLKYSDTRVIESGQKLVVCDAWIPLDVLKNPSF